MDVNVSTPPADGILRGCRYVSVIKEPAYEVRYHSAHGCLACHYAPHTAYSSPRCNRHTRPTSEAPFRLAILSVWVQEVSRDHWSSQLAHARQIKRCAAPRRTGAKTAAGSRAEHRGKLLRRLTAPDCATERRTAHLQCRAARGQQNPRDRGLTDAAAGGSSEHELERTRRAGGTRR